MLEFYVLCGLGITFSLLVCWSMYAHKWGPYLEDLPDEPDLMSEADKLYNAAYECLGIDVTPFDEVSDEVACVVSVEAVHKKARGFYVGGATPCAATWVFAALLAKHPKFKKIDAPEKGCIVVYSTGEGNGEVRGHALIMGERWAMSNTSSNGLWAANYTPDGLRRRFELQGGISPYYFRPI